MKLPDVLSSMLRGMIIPRPGCKFFVADFKQIEARVLTWSAGDNAKLELFRQGVDLYKLQASNLYGVSFEAVTKDQRQGAKSGELAYQYEGGINAMHTFSVVYNVSLRPLYQSVWANATPEEQRKAIWSAKDYLQKHGDDDHLDHESALVADIFKQRWRATNPITKEYWRKLENAIIQAVLTGNPQRCGKSIWFTDGVFLYCRLPSGRDMVYPHFKLEQGVDRYGRSKYEITYKGMDKGYYRRKGTYGGKLSENETQAISRDFMTDTIQRLEPVFPVTFHVHDELICEVPDWYTDQHFEYFKQLCSVVPLWGEGLPLEIDADIMFRYGKVA